MKATIFAFTKNGVNKSVKLLGFLKDEGYQTTIYAPKQYALELDEFFEIQPDLKTVTKNAFYQCRLIIFISALGITVRTIADFIKDKTKDPAVLCIDDLGRYVIPVLSGHIGRANATAVKISKWIGAKPIITTATDINGVFSVDEWATRQGLYICDIKKAKTVSKALLDGEKVGFCTEFTVLGNLPNGIVCEQEQNTGIVVTLNENNKPYKNTLVLIPQIIYIGIGCKKNTSVENIESAVFSALKEENISIHAVAGIGSIDLKENEAGLLGFADKYRIKTAFYPANELENVQGQFTKSEFVQKITSVDNVCERAAVLSANNGKLIKSKTVINSVTVAFAMADWSVSFEN